MGFRLSPQQRRLWPLQENGRNCPYRVQCAVLIEGDLNLNALKTALQLVVQRHEILRTTFQRLPGMSAPVQVIAEKSEPSLRIYELDDSGTQEHAELIDALLDEMSRTPFDLEHGPVLNGSLVTLSLNKYVLLLSLPALNADAATLEILLREIYRNYATCLEGDKISGESLQYADLSEWQNELLESEETESGRKYWSEQNLSGWLNLKLPIENGSLTPSEFAPRSMAITFPQETVEQVEALTGKYDLPFSVFWLACWQIWLTRLVGQSDIVVGVACDGRKYKELEDALGLFARYLPVHCHLEEDSAFSQVLKRVDEITREVYQWQESFTWDRIDAFTENVSEPSFCSFSFDFGEQIGDYSAEGARFSIYKRSVYLDRFKVRLSCVRLNDGLIAEFHYDTSSFRAEDIRRAAEQFQALVNSAFTNPDAAISSLEALSQAERHQLLVAFNQTKAEYHADRRLHSLFEEQVERAPNQIAVVFEDQHLSYSELNSRANQTAHYLQKKGVGPETPVGVCMERSLEMVVAVLGILKAGGAYVPMDPAYPRERLRFMIENSGVSITLSQEQVVERLFENPAASDGKNDDYALPDLQSNIVCLDSDWKVIVEEREENPTTEVTAENMAYVIYTSGSTGRPKGVMIPHRAISNRILWMLTTFPFTEADSVLQKTPFNFDASIWELFVPLSSGARLIMARPGGHQDPAYFVQVTNEQQVTTLQFVPSMFSLFLEQPGIEECKSLKRVFCGGEALQRTLQDRAFARLHAELHNLYGPTENAIDATSWSCQRGSHRPIVPIGRPLANVQTYLLDNHWRLVPIGAPGQLGIGGAGVARGYLNRPDLTAERFIPNPFSDLPGARLYQTGDLARYRPDGALEFLGRIDHQIKLRGFRIELGEIEAALRRHPVISECVVLAREDELDHKRLVAYMVRKPLYKLPNELEVLHFNQSETSQIYKEIFEDRTYARHGVTLNDGDCVFDVGANIGLFTLFIHHQCKNARVYAFEPIPPTFDLLRRNIEYHGVKTMLFECGLSNEAKKNTFDFYPKWSGMSGMYVNIEEDERVTRAVLLNRDAQLTQYADELLKDRFEARRYTCQLRSLSEVIVEHEIERIDLLKVDVEKAELDVLNGIQEADWQKIKQIIIEVHGEERVALITALLRGRGYNVVSEQDDWLKDTGIYNLYAIHPSRDERGSTEKRTRLSEPLPSWPQKLNLTASELRQFLERQLPDYMTPQSFVLLDSLPLMPNGKIDRNALTAQPLPKSDQREFVAPHSIIENKLAEIWSQVLGVEQVGIYDNFFELGGDSIISIQIVARAHQAGLRLTPRQLFQHQNVAELAAVAEISTASAAEQGIISGSLPLTPIQRSFFRQETLNPAHFNQSMLLAVDEGIEPRLIEQALQRIVMHHDALRLRFERGSEGWQANIVSAEPHAIFAFHDLSGQVAEEQTAQLKEILTQTQKSLDLGRGPLIRAAMIDLGADRGRRLLIAINHLAVDSVSWRILLEDLETACRQLQDGMAVRLPAKTTSFREWAQRLEEYAGSEELERELSYWLAESRRQVKRIPKEIREEDNTMASVGVVRVGLNEEQTRALLREVPGIYHTQINDVLLMPLAQVLSEWSGQPRVLIDLEGHGREEVLEGADLSRTVGWFTTVYPVVLECGEGTGIGEKLKSIKEQLRTVPNRGLGYGVLRYIRGGEQAGKLEASPEAEVSFNYLGQFDQVLGKESLFPSADEDGGPTQGAEERRRYLLDVLCIVINERLQIEWSYSERAHDRALIERLAGSYVEALRELIAHCQSPGAGGYSPSDFPLVSLQQAEIDKLLQAEPQLVDIYPLSPIQQGLLFHSLYSPESGFYFNQTVVRLKGDLDSEAFREAWQRVTDRHTILRTSFLRERHAQGVQVVLQRLEVPWKEEDWTGRASSEQEEEIAVLLEEDRERGFDYERAPLMRMVLIRRGEQDWNFIWSFHHLLLDGWSVQLVMREVFEYYEGISQGKRVELAPSRPYRDYVEWLQKQDLGEAERYWRKRLEGFTSPTQLSVDRAESQSMVMATEQGEEEIRLEAGLSERLRGMARKWQVTLNTMVNGVWALLLSRYSGEGDIVFGATVSGRPGELVGVDRMVGLFINALPVRVEVIGSLWLVEWLKRLQDEQAEQRQYEYSPLVEVQRWSEAPRGEELFKSFVVFENYPVDNELEERLSTGAMLRVVEARSIERTHYPLVVTVSPERELGVRISYDRGRYDDATAVRMIRHVASLLESMASEDEKRVCELEMLTEAERERILVEWNDTQVEYPGEKRLHELFEEQVEKSPEAVAVVFENDCLSYGELNRRANRLGHHLRELGVRPDDRVAICVERSMEMVIGLLAILKSGGAYVPLDPTYPAERLADMLEDSAPVVFLTHDATSTSLDKQLHATTVLNVDSDARQWANQPEHNPAHTGVEQHARSLAYSIYTSGSTGQPKGAMNEHRAVVNRLAWMQQAYELTSDDAVLQKTPFSFDVSVWEFFWPLLFGSRLVVARPEGHKDPSYLASVIQQQKITTMHFVPSMLQSFLEYGGASECHNLKRVVCSGEALPAWLTQRFYNQLPETDLYNLYGPTEAAVDVTAWDCRNSANSVGIPIGSPIANTRIYILNLHGRPSSIGVAGEIYIGGVQVGRGYLSRPTLTAERFLPDPFSGEPGARMYKTGDLGRWLPEGEIEFLGRNDYQVKIRGYRIELEEIQARLLEHGAVREAVVVAIEAEGRGKLLAAYLVGRDGKEVGQGELRSFLKERLPDYMIPSIFVQMEALPLTASGKIDRRALPKPDGERPELAQGYVAARTPLEQMLVDIWSQVLGVERVGTYDNFFELGGHSLLATQIIARLRRVFQVESPMRNLFERPTVADLAALVEADLSAGPRTPLPPIRPVPREGALQPSFAQQRLWFLDQLDPGNIAYNIYVPVRLCGALDLASLERTFHTLIQRHESLRTTFRNVAGQPMQVIREPERVTLSVIDLREAPEAEREAEMRRLVMADAQRPFDLEKGPLMRVSVLRLRADENVMVVTMHHIITDGWSMGVLIREIGALYQSFASGQSSPLPELPIQYADYACWQRQWMSGEVLETQLGYWRRQLAGELPALELPTDRPRPAVQRFNGARQSIALGPELSRSLQVMSREQGVTLFMTLLAAFKTLLHRYTGETDIVVGSQIANRTQAEVEDLIGYFINTLVLRTNLSGNPSFRELLSRVRETALGAYAHQDLPFEKLVEELRPDRDLSRHTPLFQVLFELNNMPLATLELGGLNLSEVEIETKTAKFDLTFSLIETGEELQGEIGYNTDLFDEATVNRMFGHYRRLLEGITVNSEQRLSDLPLLTRAERHQLLLEWNRTKRDYSSDPCLHELFEAQAEQCSEAVAVIYKAEYLSYGELNRRANQVGHYLRSRGVGPEVRVGICMERGPEMVIGLIGILKSGGAYVPLEANHPAERIAYMLRGSAASVLLTQQRISVRLPEEIRAEVVCLDKEWEKIRGQAVDNPEKQSCDKNLAYIYYTSGSTGRPKGVAMAHKGIVNYVLWGVEAYGAREGNGAAVHSSIAVDLTLTNFLALFVGKPLELVEENQGVEGLVEAMKRKPGWSFLKITPTHLAMLNPELNREEMSGSVRALVIGADFLVAEPTLAWRDGAPTVSLINEYGPTETVVGCSIYRIDEETVREGAVPIGKPIDNITMYVLDREMELAPVGVAGELYIGGIGVARGYWGLSELTAEKFVPDPFGEEGGGRMYRTGDWARYTKDGDLEFLGRSDNQVKMRGYRIELGEIEAALSAHPRVKKAMVVVTEDEPGEKRLVAYAGVGKEGTTEMELREYLLRHLPEYMVPMAYVVMEELPVGPSGKIDPRSLPKPERRRPELEQGYVAARTPLEQMLVDIWSEVLGVERVGIYDNFFELGGHSLSVSRLASRIRLAFNVEAPLRALFLAPTIAEMSLTVAALQAEQEDLTEIGMMLEELKQLSPEEIEAQLQTEHPLAI